MPELLEDNAVGEALATDADPLQDAVAAELVKHQVGVQLPGLHKQRASSEFNPYVVPGSSLGRPHGPVLARTRFS